MSICTHIQKKSRTLFQLMFHITTDKFGMLEFDHCPSLTTISKKEVILLSEISEYLITPEATDELYSSVLSFSITCKNEYVNHSI